MSTPDFALVDVVANVQCRIVNKAVGTEAVFVVDDVVDGAGGLENG